VADEQTAARLAGWPHGFMTCVEVQAELARVTDALREAREYVALLSRGEGPATDLLARIAALAAGSQEPT
jgi:hypothetical protein